MQHRVAHTLNQILAKRAANCAWEVYQREYQQYSPECSWVSNNEALLTFSAKGVKVRGQIVLEPGAIAFDIKVPLLLRVFQKQALHMIEKEIQRWVEKAENGTLPE